MHKNIKYPDKITLKWLFQYVPWTFWAGLIGLLISAFTLGLTVSETPIYKTIKSNISSLNTTGKKT